MIRKILIALLILIINVPAQESAPESSQSAGFGTLTIIYNDNAFSVNNGNISIASVNISGKKVLSFPAEKGVALIVNYGFTGKKENYAITYYLLDKEKGVVNTGEITGYYDMPHPLFAVNETGVIAYCDPGTLKLTIDNYGKKSDVKLFGNIEYEMERAIFIRSDMEKAYVTGNLKPAALELQDDNVFVASVKLNNQEIEKKMLPFLAVKSFEISNDRLILDAYHFRSGYTEKRVFADKELKVFD